MAFAAVMAVAVVCTGTAFDAGAEIVDQVVATIDTEVILLSDIMTEIAPEVRALRSQATNAAEFNRAVDKRVKATLEQAIESKILYREAQLAGIQLNEDAIEKELQELRKPYDTVEEFLNDLEASGETMSDLRDRLKKRYMSWAMARHKHEALEKGVVVSESEVAQYYEDNKSEFERPERVRCRQIMLPRKEGEDPALTKARLEEVKLELEAGANFADLAEAFSGAANAEEGGIIGWVTRGRLVGPLDEAAFSTSEGAISGIVETEFGFHVVRVDRKEEAGLAPLDEVRKEIEPTLRARAADTRYQKWMGELRKRSRVRVFL
ncbi:MAG: hypothetical protein GY851_13580 [bacterium]|nr:hypothetical protein [bacterium]